MLRKRTCLISLTALAFALSFAGIIRHDVNAEKYASLARQKQFDCVGEVFRDTAFSGSCVLIHERYVLSAAHVFIDRDTRPDTIQLNGQTVIAFMPINERPTDASKIHVVYNNQRIGVKRVILHPAYMDSLTKGFCDLAILELDQPVPSISPASLNKLEDELHAIATGVGYGNTGPADLKQEIKNGPKKMAGENEIDSIGGEQYQNKHLMLLCDFDHPTRTDCNKMGSSKPLPLEYICGAGDSGGGLFRKNNNKWELIGICSGSGTDVTQFLKTGFYGQTMQWTRVSVLNDWITKQLH